MNSKSTIIKALTIDGTIWQLRKVTETRHFKNGKANLHVAATYNVEIDWEQELSAPEKLKALQSYHYTSKAKAAQYLKSLEKSAVIVESSGVEALSRIFG